MALLGFACLVATPVLYALMWVSLSQLGKALAAVDAATWDSIKPTMSSSFIETRERSRRLKEFISDHEYVALGDPRVTALAQRFHRIQIATYVAMLGGMLTVLWAVFL